MGAACPLHIPPQTANNIMKVVLTYLLLGSYGLLIWRWRPRGVELCHETCEQTTKGSPRAKACTLIFVALASCWATPVAGDFFKIDGRLDATFYKATGDLQTNQQFGFEVEFDPKAPRWVIRTYFSKRRDWYYETTGLGQDVFSIHYNPNVNRSWNMPGTACRGGYPALQFYPVLVPWLAFCSAHFIAGSNEANIPFVFSNAASDPSAHVTETKVSLLSSGVVALPKEIRWQVTEERLKNAGDSPWLRVPLTESELKDRSRDLRYQFKVGSEVCFYSVQSQTNIQGMELPTEFSIRKTRYIPVRDKSGKVRFSESMAWNDYLHAVIQGSVDHIQMVTGEMTLQRFPKPVDVADYRLNDKKRGIGYVHYAITNGYWRTNIDADLIARLDSLRSKAGPTVADLQNRRSILIRVSLVVAVLLPPIVFAIWKSRALHVKNS